MSYWVNHLMGNSENEPAFSSLSSLFDELSEASSEHTDVSLTHESEWCLSAFQSGLVVCENLAGEGEPKHMRNIQKDKIISLWQKLAQGKISEIHHESWLKGYGK